MYLVAIEQSLRRTDDHQGRLERRVNEVQRVVDGIGQIAHLQAHYYVRRCPARRKSGTRARLGGGQDMGSKVLGVAAPHQVGAKGHVVQVRATDPRCGCASLASMLR